MGRTGVDMALQREQLRLATVAQKIADKRAPETSFTQQSIYSLNFRQPSVTRTTASCCSSTGEGRGGGFQLRVALRYSPE